MFAGRDKLPYGNLPRQLAWVSAEAVRTQRRDRTREVAFRVHAEARHGRSKRNLAATGPGFRNQMKRLFGCSVQLIYDDERVTASMTSLLPPAPSSGGNKPDEPMLFNSKIRLGEDL